MLRHLDRAPTDCFFALPRRVVDTNPTNAQRRLAFRIWLFLALPLILLMGLSTLLSAQMVMDVDHEMESNSAKPQQAYTLVSCGQSGEQSLPAGDYNSDLHVVGTCKADGTLGGGMYKYHWVFIHSGGTLTFSDAKLDLYANSILVLNGGTLQAGGATDKTAIGYNGGLVAIHLWGKDTDDAIPCQDANGNKDGMCGIPKNIWDVNKMNPEDGFGRPCKRNSVYPPDDCFYQYDDPAVSPLYFGRKTLAVSYGGTLLLFGRKGSTFDGLTPPPQSTGKSWRRLATNLKADEATFDVDGEVDWQVGDHIVITPTDYLPGHAEEAIISDVMPNGTKTTIVISGVVLDDGTTKSGGVRFPHNGTTFPIPSGIKTKLNLDRSEIDTRAAVALLTRNICVISEGDTAPGTPQRGCNSSFPPPPTDGKPGYFFGGHVIFRQGFKKLQVQGVQFRQLGQGGLIGRYAVHFHMARQVQPDTFVKDCSIDESMTRWITVHGTQKVLLARNVGWKSIGHGFYIEDGTETDNKFYANIGILARAGIVNSQNPRQVPGILANSNPNDIRSPYNSDWQHPSVFWIMNGWNDFEYNMAAGANSCGVCYWLPQGANSGPSRYEYWWGYASRQREFLGRGKFFNAGTAPLQTFKGNSCSTAMLSFMEVGNPDFNCVGIGQGGPIFLPAIPGKGDEYGPDEYYPIVTGVSDPTECNDLNKDCGDPDIKCGGANDAVEANCMPTVLDHYTTSFNWSEKNFSSIWLRPWWKLATDSAITDQLGPGLTMVTSGNWSRASVALGNWDVALRNVYVGQTQPDPSGPNDKFFASDLGPFTKNGIPQCDNGKIPGSYCLSKDNGITMLLTNFNAGQRMFNIYDGPSFQDSSAYLNITARGIPDCSPQTGDKAENLCDNSQYMYGHSVGLLKGTDPKTKNVECFIPNAAIAWKQENGFYYPPSFHSKNLVFSDVDIRHFVVEPQFKLNTFESDVDKIKATYCTWSPTMFNPFGDVDRQTVLNDDDGSLTGLLANTQPSGRETLSVNEDAFFRAPNVLPECSSNKHYPTTDQKGKPATATTSPYEYVNTVVTADCARDGCGGNWEKFCPHCYGVPLFRQYWTPQDNSDCDANTNCPRVPLARPGRILMMGQDGQRDTLTANQGWYYIDTTVSASDGSNSVFLSGHTYYVYLLYGKPDTHMDYWMYVGSGADEQTVVSQVGRLRVGINDVNYQFVKVNIGDSNNPEFLTNVKYDPMTGWLKVTLDLSKYASEFEEDKPAFCKPKSYCSWNKNSDGTESCGCAAGSDCKDSSVCRWGTKDLDCPTVAHGTNPGGCFGFSFQIQPQFDQNPKPGPPMPQAFPQDMYWNVKTAGVDEDISGSECYYGSPQ